MERMVMKRVLVAFGTMSGSTREVAEAIAEEVRQAGYETDVKRAPDVKSVKDYAAAVIGGPVMGGMLAGGVPAMIRRNKRALQSMPVALFVTCGAMSDPTEQNKTMAAGYLAKLRKVAPEIAPVDTAVFGGGIKTSGPDFDRAFFFFKFIIPKVAAEFKDGRDFDAIRAWARQVSAKVQAAGEAGEKRT
jgi:menaquinone-dependent protoporphyrinogen oxidase